MGEIREKVVMEFSSDGTKLEQGLSGMERKAARAGAALENSLKFKGEKAVKRQFKGFLKDAASVNSASDLAAQGMIHFGESLKVGMGTMIGLTAAVFLYDKMAENITKAKEAQDAINESMQRGLIKGQGIGELTKSRDEIGAAAKEFDRQGNSATSRMLNDVYGRVATLFDAFDFTVDLDKVKITDPNRDNDRRKAEATQDLHILNQLITVQMSDQADIQEMLANGDTKRARIKSLELQNEEKLAAIKADKNNIDGAVLEKANQQIRINQANTSLLKQQIELEEKSMEVKVASSEVQMRANDATFRGNTLKAKAYEMDIKKSEIDFEYTKMIAGGVNPGQAEQYRTSRLHGIDQEYGNAKVQEEIKRRKNPTGYDMAQRLRDKEYDRAQRKVAERDLEKDPIWKTMGGEDRKKQIDERVRKWNPVDPKAIPDNEQGLAEAIGAQLKSALEEKTLLIFQK